MKTAIKLIRLQSCPIFQQLLLEEALYRDFTDNFCVVNQQISTSAIVLGLSGVLDKLLHLDAVRQDSVCLIRRYSGGGTVLVDSGTIFVSFVMNARTVNINPYPRDIMQWTKTVYSDVFKEIFPIENEFDCRENDYVFKGSNKKFGGNAQAISRDRFVHHTSFLYHIDPSAISRYLKLPEKRPQYRENRSHGDFLGCIQDALPNTSISDFTDNVIIRGLRNQFHVEDYPSFAAKDEHRSKILSLDDKEEE